MGLFGGLVLIIAGLLLIWFLGHFVGLILGLVCILVGVWVLISGAVAGRRAP